MSNQIVTPEMFKIMRNALGLGPWQKKPDRNHVVPDYRGKDDANIQALLDMELLETRQLVGPTGSHTAYVVSNEGRRLVMDAQAHDDANQS